jgi:hypothetical protein
MVRRSNSDKKNNEVQKEDNVSTAAPEAPASTETPAVENATAEAPKAEVEVDLTDFEAAVNAAVSDTEGRDATTGELVPALIEPVNAEFRKLDGAKAKNKARALLGSLMKETMNKLDMPLARSYMILSENLSAGSSGGAKSERTPADPTEAFVQRMVGLKLAAALAQANVPEGVDENWSAKANELYKASEPKANSYLAWVRGDEETRGDEPEVSPVVRSAVKLAQGKSAKVGGSVRSGGAGDGVRRDIGKHIESAFADVESGTFLTISEIRNHKSEEYGENPPSAGAISARLFPSSRKASSVDGITAGQN